MDKSFEKLADDIRKRPSLMNIITFFSRTHGVQHHVHPVDGTLLHVAFCALLDSLNAHDLSNHRSLIMIIDALVEAFVTCELNSECFWNDRWVSLAELALLYANIVHNYYFVIRLMILGAKMTEEVSRRVGCNDTKFNCFAKQYFSTPFVPPIIMDEGFHHACVRFKCKMNEGIANHNTARFRYRHDLRPILHSAVCPNLVEFICNNEFDLNIWSTDGRALEVLFDGYGFSYEDRLRSVKMFVKAGAIVDYFTELKAHGIVLEWLKKYRLRILLLAVNAREKDSSCLLTILNKDIIKLILL